MFGPLFDLTFSPTIPLHLAAGTTAFGGMTTVRTFGGLWQDLFHIICRVDTGHSEIITKKIQQIFFSKMNIFIFYLPAMAFSRPSSADNPSTWRCASSFHEVVLLFSILSLITGVWKLVIGSSGTINDDKLAAIVMTTNYRWCLTFFSTLVFLLIYLFNNDPSFRYGSSHKRQGMEISL